jgi:hypothetical protein
MKRSLSVLAALFLAATPAMAQNPQQGGVSADSMTGVWEGPFTTDHGPGGTMSVTVAHDSAGVKATMTISAHMDVPPSTLANIRHDGGKITWTQETSGMSCAGSASHNTEGALVGSLDCGHAIISFTLTKSAPAKGK